MAFYDEMQEIATGLLTEFNQGVIQLVKRTAGSGPAFNPGVPSESTVTLHGVTRGVLKRYVNGTTVVDSDLQATVAVPADMPEIGDKLLIDNKLYSIVAINPIPASGTAVSLVLIYR